jgi:hypothetical protein
MTAMGTAIIIAAVLGGWPLFALLLALVIGRGIRIADNGGPENKKVRR